MIQSRFVISSSSTYSNFLECSVVSPGNLWFVRLKLQELEMENARLKQDLQSLRKSISDSTDLDGSGRKGGVAAKKFMGK